MDQGIKLLVYSMIPGFENLYSKLYKLSGQDINSCLTVVYLTSVTVKYSFWVRGAMSGAT